MKKKLIIVMLFVFSGILGVALASCTKGVPKAVKTAFSAKYPKAQKVEWENEDGEFEAEFKLNGEKMSATFMSDGSWVESEMEMKEIDLPEAVKEVIDTEFPDYKIEGVERVERPAQPVAYEVELEDEDGDSDIKVLFNENGKFLKKESNKEGDEDDEDDDGDDGDE